MPGRDANDAAEAALRLDDYVRHLCHVIESCPDPIALVGHSIAGVTISQAAEAMPERLAALVHVAALLLADGRRARDILAQAASSMAAKTRAPVSLCEVRSGRVTRYYVECLIDRIIALAARRAMVQASPWYRIYTGALPNRPAARPSGERMRSPPLRGLLRTRLLP